jgi:hypothetical protein
MKALKIISSMALAGAVLAGCKTTSKPVAGIEQQLSSIMGADISTAVGILGFPDERRQEPGRMVYVWASGRVSRLPQTETRMPGSYATGPDGRPLAIDSPCRVELSADDSGRIAGYQWSGSDARCNWVVQAFRRAEHEEQPR